MTTIEDPVHQVQLNQAPEPDSDTEDDPGKLLNAWLGQLNQKVNIFFQIHSAFLCVTKPVWTSGRKLLCHSGPTLE